MVAHKIEDKEVQKVILQMLALLTREEKLKTSPSSCNKNEADIDNIYHNF